MQPPIDFHPRHPQPFTLAALLQFTPSHLASEISRLQNSIAHLEDSNRQLLEAEEEGEDEEGRRVMKEAREENEVTMCAHLDAEHLNELAETEGRTQSSSKGKDHDAQTRAATKDRRRPFKPSLCSRDRGEFCGSSDRRTDI